MLEPLHLQGRADLAVFASLLGESARQSKVFSSKNLCIVSDLLFGTYTFALLWPPRTLLIVRTVELLLYECQVGSPISFRRTRRKPEFKTISAAGETTIFVAALFPFWYVRSLFFFVPTGYLSDIRNRAMRKPTRLILVGT